MKQVELDHPDRQILTAFGLGQLPDEESAPIEQHIAGCEQCRQVVSELPGDSLVGWLQAAYTHSGELDATEESSPGTQPTDQSPSENSLPPLYKKVAQILGEDQKHAAQTAGRDEDSPAKHPATLSVPKLPAELTDHPRYRVMGLLGHGGMGAVYKAEHRLMQRFVALKVIHPSLVDRPSAVDRFSREVKTAAQLSHQNIVAAFDAEKVGDTHVLVMEYVEGRTLAQTLLLEGALETDKACGYARQAALGLQHALERGMVHRDIKPQNLMLTAQGTIKILDFGLARFVSESGPDEGSTELGAVMGSPDYMAPEQAEDAHAADIRADIYGLGCTLYNLLTDQVPFPGKSLLSKLQSHRDLPPPSLKEARPDVPEGLCAVIEKMMAKDPDKRYQAPAEVADALEPFTKPIAPAVAPQPKVKVRRWQWALAASILIALLCGAALVWGSATFRFVFNQGVLVVETDDPNIEIHAKQGGKTIKIIDVATGKEIVLTAGKYQLELTKGKKGLKLETTEFALSRGGRTVLRVYWEKPHAKKIVPDPPPAKSPVEAEIKRDLAKLQGVWVTASVEGERAGPGWPRSMAQLWMSRKTIIKDAKLRFDYYPDSNRSKFMRSPSDGYSISLDTSKKPKELDLTWRPNGKTESRKEFIYEISGDSLNLAYRLVGGRGLIRGSRPKNFSAPKGSNIVVVRLKRDVSLYSPSLPLAEYLKGRKIRTVAQDGAGEFKSLADARKLLKPGEVILFLDKGPYKEQWIGSIPPDVGIVSRVGTRIEIPKWVSVASHNSQHAYRGWHLKGAANLRLSGLEFIAPDGFPADTGDAVPVDLDRVHGDITVDSCRILQTPQLGPTPPPDNTNRFFIYSVRYVGQKSAKLTLKDNYLQGGVYANWSAPAWIKIERNFITCWRWSGIAALGARGEVRIHDNVIRATSGVYVNNWHVNKAIRGSDPQSLEIVNNSFDVFREPIKFSWPGKARYDNPLVKKVRIANNIFQSQHKAGIVLDAQDLVAAKANWQVSHNVYTAKPGPRSYDGRPSLPVIPSDVILHEPYLSRDPADAARFMRISTKSSSASRGAGGDLPKFIGALPPGPAPKNGDWLTRLLFSTQRTIPGWGEVIDPDGDSRISETKVGVTIEVPGSLHGLKPRQGIYKRFSFNGPRILQGVEGDFTVQVKVSGDFNPGNNSVIPGWMSFQSAGLLLWENESQYVRLERNVWVTDKGQTQYFSPLYEYWKNGKNIGHAATVSEKPFFKKSTYLRLSRRGNVIVAGLSHDGSAWVSLKPLQIALARRIFVGVGVGGQTSKTPFKVSFSDFKLTTK